MRGPYSSLVSSTHVVIASFFLVCCSCWRIDSLTSFSGVTLAGFASAMAQVQTVSSTIEIIARKLPATEAELHARLIDNLRLGMSVFLDGHVHDAKKLLEEKARFRDLEHEYTLNHLARLRDSDALLHVVRAFEDPAHPHPAGSVDPARDLARTAS